MPSSALVGSASTCAYKRLRAVVCLSGALHLWRDLRVVFQRSEGGGGWVGKSFEEVVSEEEAELAQAGITPRTTPAEFARNYLSTRPNGFGGHR